MTREDHNKVLGIMHLIWGGFNALTLLILVPLFLVFMGVIRSDPSAPPELSVLFGFFGILFFVLAVLFGIPPIVAAYGMLKRKSWAKVASIVSACFAALSFPFGTALCVYTLWFVLGEGQNFYRAQDSAQWRGSLRDANTFDWESQRAADARRRDYAPPPQPPDWRS